MKKRILRGAAVLLVLVLLAGCEFFAELFNPLLGSWGRTETANTTTFAFSSYVFNSDNTYSCNGTFSEPVTGVSGTASGSGTFVQDQSADTISMTGSFTQKSTSGPAQFYSLFDGTVSGTMAYNYSITGKNMTLDGNLGGYSVTIKLGRQ